MFTGPRFAGCRIGHQLLLAGLLIEVTQLPIRPVQADEKPLPARVDLSTEFEKWKLPPHVQGDRDTCSSFAITGLANFEYDKEAPDHHLRLSEEFLIWAGKKSTGKPGDQAMFYEAIHGLNQLGVCSDPLMTYSKTSDPGRIPSAQAIAEARQLRERWRVEWIKRWDVKNPLTDRQMHEIKQALVNHHPVACGLRWPKKLDGYQILKALPPQDVEDGHSILFTGYADDLKNVGGGVFYFRNSWGEGWGRHGYGEMSYAYARAYANDAVWMHLGPKDSEVPLSRYEAELLPVRLREHCDVNGQAMQDYRAPLWSHGEQLFCGAHRGGFIELGFDVGHPGRYRVRVLATAAPDFGIVRVAMNGSPAHDFDLYSGRVCPSGSLELGTMNLAAGMHTLRCTAINKNPASEGFFFGLDTIDLLAAP